MRPPLAAAAAWALTVVALSSGCSNTAGPDAPAVGIATSGALSRHASAQHAATQRPITSTDDPRFFDPCTDDMLAWFAERGLPKVQHIEPEKDDRASGCTFGNHDYSLSIMTQLSTPGDATDQWVHEIMDVEGDVESLVISGHVSAMSIDPVRDARQDCHVLVTTSFGFLHVFGGPHGTPATPPPRDCDRSRTLAAAILAKMDE